MRFGQNPYKTNQTKITPPASITIGVLNYIPEQTGYFAGQLDALKLCLESIRQHADRPFDLLVVDNGSCAEVRDYLCAEMEAGRIDYLILNSRNIGKGNALFQILRSAPGDFIFYSDGDIYYQPGWMSAHLELLDAFPEAGMIGGIPLRNLANYHTETTRRWAEANQEFIQIEKGDLIPELWTREFLRSVGDEHYIENWIHNEDWKITRDKTEAFIGACHMQFLISRRVVDLIPYRRFEMALHSEETKTLDDLLDNSNLLRLSVPKPMVYHLGNLISEPWLISEYENLVGKATDLNKNQKRIERIKKSGFSQWFWRRWRVRQGLEYIYRLTFNILTENSDRV